MYFTFLGGKSFYIFFTVVSVVRLIPHPFFVFLPVYDLTAAGTLRVAAAANSRICLATIQQGGYLTFVVSGLFAFGIGKPSRCHIRIGIVLN